jgi:hypothetical protein
MFMSLLRVYALTGDDAVYDLIAAHVGATLEALGPRYRDPYLRQLASGLDAVRAAFPQLGEAAAPEPTASDEVGSRIDLQDAWTWDAPGWTPEPTEADPEFAAAAADICLDPPTQSRRARRELAELPSVPTLQDQRGDSGAFVLWVAPEFTYSCFIYWDDFEYMPGFDTFGDTWRPTGPGMGSPSLSVISTSNAPVAEMEGLVDRGAARVEIETQSGRVVEATLGGGHFIAWWPTGDQAKRVRAYAPDGSLIDEVMARADGRFAAVLPSPDSTASPSVQG